MARLRWSRRAAENLTAICEFISQDSDQYARALAQRVHAAAKEAATYPNAGRVVPEFRKLGLREKIVGNYRVVYRPGTDAVVILAVTHGARLLGKEAIEDNP
jgi:toxin ParE1/3/4